MLAGTQKGELVQVNFTEMKDQIADQIRAFLLNSMPKAAFDNVIQVAWDKLTKPRIVQVGGGYHATKEERPSELEEMVTAEMRKAMLGRVKTWSVEWANREAGTIDATTQAALEALATKCAQLHLQTVGQQIVSHALTTMSLSQGTIRPCTTCGRLGTAGDYCACGSRNRD